MSYKKGKDIKIPFDCLWHCYTRKFETLYTQVDWSGKGTDFSFTKPEEFEKW